MRLIKYLLLLILLLAGGLGFYASRPLALPTLPFEFAINQGSSLKAAVRQMQQLGMLSNDWMFVWLGRALGKTTQIKAGNYELETAPTPFELLDIMTNGRVNQNEISVIDGWTFNQLRDSLNANPTIHHDTAALSEAEIMQQLGAPIGQAEGLFFPDTYYFSSGSSDL